MKLSKYMPGTRGVRYGGVSIAALAAVVSAGLLVVSAGSAQAAATVVPLGTAGQFAVLAGSGITNTGASTIVGDTGSSPTSSETGFAACPGAANCVTLTGTNHTAPNPNDAVTQQAKTALTTAYNNAAGQGPTTQVPTELAGQKLVGGVYNSASGTFGMSGTLVLDGANNPNSVFIFQTASTLITGSTGNVNLVRGASSCNIFWKVGSAATLGAGSTFRGTILAHDNISLGNAVTVDGRLLGGEQASGTGAVTLIHDTITTPTCTTPPTTTTTRPPTSTPPTSTTMRPPTSTTTAPPRTTTPAPTGTTTPPITTTPAGPTTTGAGPGGSGPGPGAGSPGPGGPGAGSPGPGGPGAGSPGGGSPGPGGSGPVPGASRPGPGGPGAGQVARIPAGAVEAGDGSTS